MRSMQAGCRAADRAGSRARRTQMEEIPSLLLPDRVLVHQLGVVEIEGVAHLRRLPDAERDLAVARDLPAGEADAGSARDPGRRVAGVRAPLVLVPEPAREEAGVVVLVAVPVDPHCHAL